MFAGNTELTRNGARDIDARPARPPASPSRPTRCPRRRARASRDEPLVFRLYGPTDGYIDKTWVLDDLELIR
jgi:hypothetical protein